MSVQEETFREYITHADPEVIGQTLIMAYLSGRADMVDELRDGFVSGVRPLEVFARAAREDAEIAERYGLPSLWTAGQTEEEAARAPLPTEADLGEVLKRMQAAWGGEETK